MGKIHFAAVVCANRHVMMGIPWSIEQTTYEQVRQSIFNFRAQGQACGIFKGRCANCQSPDLSIHDFDTGCETMQEAMQWINAAVEAWRTDRPKAPIN